MNIYSTNKIASPLIFLSSVFYPLVTCGFHFVTHANLRTCKDFNRDG